MVYFDSSNGTTIGVPDKLMRQLGGKLQVVEKKNFGTFPENPADLLLWNGSGDGNFTAVRGGGRPALKGRKLSGLPVVSVGRADSGETLGFIVRDADEKQLAGFVLDRKQVRALVNYLRWSLQRLKPARGAR